MPVDGVDTIYTCRKFFGVTDGAILYTDMFLDEQLETDESFQRMTYIMGRFERCASEFYALYNENNLLFNYEPIKRMSILTENILKGIDYAYVRKSRTENFKYLHDRLGEINKLKIFIPEGAFMYPLYIDNGAKVRKRLISKKIYIPTLWTDTLDYCETGGIEIDLSVNILPLPVDQRYGRDEMNTIIQEIVRCIS